MGDAESESHPSKKRAAGVQLTRDSSSVDDDETLEQESGTFKRASDEVLAARRIVKVRRQPASSTSIAQNTVAASNPFAAVCLVPAISVSPQVFEAGENGVKENKQTKDDDQIEKQNIAPVKGTEKTETSEDNSKQLEVTEGISEGGVNTPKVETDNVDKVEGSNSVDEASENNKLLDEARQSTDADNTNIEAKESTEIPNKDNEQGKEESSTEKSKENTSFGSFGLLSSSQNAFSGLSGTGFSSTSFSFGSIPKVGSSGTFSFGSNNADSSILNANQEPLSIIGSNKISPLQEVTVETGEENEKAIFAADAALFEFTAGCWKERGKGELKLNVNIDTVGTHKARLLMRTKGNFRLILNANLYPEMTLKSMDKRGISFACVNTATEGKDGLSLTTFALKFKDASIVDAFQIAVAEHKTPEHSTKA